MQDIKVTVASLRSELNFTDRNLAWVRGACETAKADGARMVLMPELMLTGHGGHPSMLAHAEAVPAGPLSQAVLALSEEFGLCLVVGIAERVGESVFNSQMVVDRGNYLGLQRKIQLSGDENNFFKPGERLEVFEIDEVRFGIMICRDNLFGELAIALGLQGAELILSPHAARTGIWPDELTGKFCALKIKQRQNYWETIHRARAYDNRVYNLVCNAVGSSTGDLEDVVSNHAGTVMGVDPAGKIFLRTSKADMTEEVVTVLLEGEKVKTRSVKYRKQQVEVALKLLTESRRCLDAVPQD